MSARRLTRADLLKQTEVLRADVEQAHQRRRTAERELEEARKELGDLRSRRQSLLDQTARARAAVEAYAAARYPALLLPQPDPCVGFSAWDDRVRHVARADSESLSEEARALRHLHQLLL